MIKKYAGFNFTFGVIFIAQLVTESIFLTEILAIEKLHFITKPLIVISLLALLIYHTGLRGRFAKRIGLGLFFGLAGDVFLMFQEINSTFFIWGLISFLIGHIFYISAFYLDYLTHTDIGKKYINWSLVGFGFFCLLFYLFLQPYLGSMKMPVLLYAIVISLMAVAGISRYDRVNSFSFKMIFIGAILFIISDSILVINKFVAPFSMGGTLIMATYMLSQYMITMGAIERKFKKRIKTE